MGCGDSKKAPAEEPKAAGGANEEAKDKPFSNTLVEDPVQKQGEAPKQSSDGPFSAYVDPICSSGWVSASADGKALRVDSVQGGPFGLWNNRARTVKVKCGDLISQVRKVGPAMGEWIADDAAKMLDALQAAGVSEVTVNRPQEQEPAEPKANDEGTKIDEQKGSEGQMTDADTTGKNTSSTPPPVTKAAQPETLEVDQPNSKVCGCCG